MSKLKRYDAVVNGHATTLKLTEAEAKERGLVEAKQAEAPANKARTPRNKKS
ncbi:hypothetical protein [Isoptericola sp. NPDC056134]|uniref:hypothetical protein n=1 Tax=Isoptericola sp. NPDC056134 TaxID=3345723 RepID=UPI0035ED30CC